jgi:hypothetical protein
MIVFAVMLISVATPCNIFQECWHVEGYCLKGNCPVL